MLGINLGTVHRTDYRTDRRTERRTDRRTERGALGIRLAILALLIGLAVLGYRIPAKSKRVLNDLDAHFVVLDLKSGKYRVSPALASGEDGFESFASMVDRLQPYAAISGTYHDPDSRPLGDIVIDGRVVNRGCERQGIGFTRDGAIKFLERSGDSKINWNGCESGIACGPRLLKDGRVDIDLERDGFTSKAGTIMARRCAVGASADGKLILCAVGKPVTLAKLAELMKEVGAQDAVNLDGGSLCALYEEGDYHAEPFGPVTNMLVVHPSQ